MAGREFTLHDRYGLAKVVIVNESFARKYFPDGDPVGHLMKIGQDPSDPLDMTSKTRGTNLRGRLLPYFYNLTFNRSRFLASFIRSAPGGTIALWRLRYEA
jgi:hypothetical protein